MHIISSAPKKWLGRRNRIPDSHTRPRHYNACHFDQFGQFFNFYVHDSILTVRARGMGNQDQTVGIKNDDEPSWTA